MFIEGSNLWEVETSKEGTVFKSEVDLVQEFGELFDNAKADFYKSNI